MAAYEAHSSSATWTWDTNRNLYYYIHLENRTFVYENGEVLDEAGAQIMAPETQR
jgi:hypothetical protein